MSFFISTDSPQTTPVDVAIRLAAEKLGISGLTLTGGSGRGWSRQRTFQECPYKFNRMYVQPQLGPRWPDGEPQGLAVGSLIHAFLAVYYQQIINWAENGPELPDLGEFCDAILDAGANAVFVEEAWRMFDRYAAFYETIGDYIDPLAVEYRIEDPIDGNTCRYDLVAKVTRDSQVVVPGTYIIEHKSSGRLGRDVTEGWALDGEIVGQVMLWTRGDPSPMDLWGPLDGVIVNLLVKTKIPQFQRIVVEPPEGVIERHLKDLRVQRGLEAMYAGMNYWPRQLASCWGRYGPCRFFDECQISGEM